MIQYWAALFITGKIKGTSRDRLYQEIGLESLNLWQIEDGLVRYFSSIKLSMDSCPHTFSHN